MVDGMQPTHTFKNGGLAMIDVTYTHLITQIRQYPHKVVCVRAWPTELRGHCES